MRKKHPEVEVTVCDNCKKIMQSSAAAKHMMTCRAVVPQDGRIQE
jgi:predicted Rdx family selenoprotein